MSIINGGGVSGVSPQKFDTDIGEVKALIQDVDADVAVVDGKIDTIDANVDTLLAGRIVKSVQRGSNVGITVSNNKSVATISKVNTAKSVIIHSQILNANATHAALTLDSSGTQILCVMAGGSLSSQTFGWQVVEFY